MAHNESISIANRRPLLVLMVAACLWGAAISGTKYALRGFNPLTLLSVELVAATAGLWVALIARGYRPPRSWRLPVLLGLLEPALAYLGDTLGLARTSAVDGSIVSGLEPAFVVTLAAVLLSETITRTALAAIAVALIGLVVLTGTGGHHAAVGDLCVGAGIVAASLYTIVAKRYDDGSDTLSLTTWQFSAASVAGSAMVGLRWLSGADHPPTAVAPRYWLAAAAVGVAGFALSFFLYNRVIVQVDAGWAAIVLNLIPAFGLVSAIVLLGEKPTSVSVVGATLIGASVVSFTIADHRGALGSVIQQPDAQHAQARRSAR
jgi:O-acetylserine/cysteine efflux transporter